RCTRQTGRGALVDGPWTPAEQTRVFDGCEQTRSARLMVPLACDLRERGGAMSTVDTATDVRPFEVRVPEEQIEDLRRRIAATRWPTSELVADRSQGVQLATVQELARYWTSEYDWRKCEARLNALPQFMTTIDGVDVHFIHVKSRHADALPLIMTHGWPGSV